MDYFVGGLLVWLDGGVEEAEEEKKVDFQRQLPVPPLAFGICCMHFCGLPDSRKNNNNFCGTIKNRKTDGHMELRPTVILAIKCHFE